MKIYLDTNVYNRPFDDQTQPRIWLETLAFAVILQMAEEGHITLIGSSVLDYENSRNPNPSRQRWVNRCLEDTGHHQPVDETIRARALDLETRGMTALDALHLASAEAANSAYFLTCDDDVVKRYRGRLVVINPVEFIVSEGKQHDRQSDA